MEDVASVRRTILSRWSGDSDKDEFALGYARIVAREPDAPVPQLFPDELSQAGLADRRLTGRKSIEPALIYLDADHPMT